MTINHKHLITISCITVIITLFSRDIFLPSLPNIALSLSATQSIIMSSITACLIGDGISQFIFGFISDVYGRKKIFLIGLIIIIIGNTITCFASTGFVFLLSRFITGLGTGTSPVLTRAIARDIYTDNALTKTISYFSMMAAISPAIAPIIGGYLQYYFGWKANFIFLILTTLSCLLLLQYYLPETFIPSDNKKLNFFELLCRYKKILLDKQLIGYALLSAVAFSFSISYFMFSPFLFQTVLHLNSSQNGMLYSFIAAGFFIGSYFVTKTVSKLDENDILVIGVALCFLSSLLFLLFHLMHYLNAFSITFSMVICVIGCGLVTPIANKKALHPFSDTAGQAAATLGIIRMLGVFITGLFVSHFLIQNGLQIALLFGLLSIAYIVIYLILLKL
ncbi:MAG: multidrug resistance protein D [uncultured bacterium]|nr:MAG: multidrug resistance protein D [uncultured bacterium]